MKIKMDKQILEKILGAVNESEYFLDDLEATMVTYRIHPTKGMQFFGPEPTLLEVAGRFEDEQEQELLGFYGSLSKLIEDVAENGTYERWCNSFVEMTYEAFISLLYTSHLISEESLAELKEDVVEGDFTRVGDFIDGLTHDMEKPIKETHQLIA